MAVESNSLNAKLAAAIEAAAKSVTGYADGNSPPPVKETASLAPPIAANLTPKLLCQFMNKHAH
ncbi:MAG TPA: hypothetical protein VMT61_12825 [Candidatus Binataceae bacterium]|nr:hypothetical protein [Candidatus Binataceae bacterium]